MKRVVPQMLLLVGLVLAKIAYAGALSEASVNQALTHFENAALGLNLEVVDQALSDDVEIILNMDLRGRQVVLRPSKQEYLKKIKDGHAQMTDYQYNRSNTVIKLQDNKAYITADINESMVLQGRPLTTLTKEQITMESRNGKFLITQLIAHTKF